MAIIIIILNFKLFFKVKCEITARLYLELPYLFQKLEQITISSRFNFISICNLV